MTEDWYDSFLPSMWCRTRKDTVTYGFTGIFLLGKNLSILYVCSNFARLTICHILLVIPRILVSTERYRGCSRSSSNDIDSGKLHVEWIAIDTREIMVTFWGIWNYLNKTMRTLNFSRYEVNFTLLQRGNIIMIWWQIGRSRDGHVTGCSHQ